VKSLYRLDIDQTSRASLRPRRAVPPSGAQCSKRPPGGCINASKMAHRNFAERYDHMEIRTNDADWVALGNLRAWSGTVPRSAPLPGFARNLTKCNVVVKGT